MGQPPYSLDPWQTVFMDFIGPVTTGEGGVKYTFCMIDNYTRRGGAWKSKITVTNSGIK